MLCLVGMEDSVGGTGHGMSEAGGCVGRRGRGGGDCLLACLPAWSLVTEDLLGCILGVYLQREASGYRTIWVGAGGPMAGGGVVAPADGSGRDTAQQTVSIVIQGKGEVNSQLPESGADRWVGG